MIDWTPTGFGSFADKLVGGRMCGKEKLLIVIPALSMAAFTFFGLSVGMNFGIRLVITLLSFIDVVGCLYVATSNAKRKYFPNGNQMSKAIFIRTMIEIVGQIIVFDALILPKESNWVFSLVLVPYSIVSVTLIWLIQLPLQRPMSILLFLIGFMLTFYAVPQPPHNFIWFTPLVLLKYIICMMPRHEAYSNLKLKP